MEGIINNTFTAKTYNSINPSFVGSYTMKPENNITHPSVKLLMQDQGHLNPEYVIRKKARDLVFKGLNKGWSGPPYDPLKLAVLMNIDVSPNEYIRDARIIPTGKTFTIEFNPSKNEKRINFSIAHELTHTLFPDCASQVRNRLKTGQDDLDLEILCDIGASEILLPFNEFGSVLNDGKLDFDKLIELSNKFGASLSSIMLRSAYVSHQQLNVVFAKYDTENPDLLSVIYSSKSKRSTLNIAKGSLIPKASVAHSCKVPGWSNHALENWPSFNGEERIIHAIGLSSFMHNREGRVGIIIVQNDGDNIQSEQIPDIKYINRDATDPYGDGKKVILQVVNTAAATGAGFGKAMATRWPQSKKKLNEWKKKGEFNLGTTQLVELTPDLWVFQLLVQSGYKNNSKPSLNYKHLSTALAEVREWCLNNNASVHTPRIGSGFGGGKWSTIESIIKDQLTSNGISVTVYDLPGSRNKKIPEQKDLFSN